MRSDAEDAVRVYYSGAEEDPGHLQSEEGRDGFLVGEEADRSAQSYRGVRVRQEGANGLVSCDVRAVMVMVARCLGGERCPSLRCSR